ncbi:ABC transporter ATP-binding protein [Oceanicella actignis]|uniref:ABC transporter ATP-binding protein n=1 Tax=Oceanicella actignis TaxID=1189325 RepID=UPI0011E812D8|nr:ATP-binding cassette domain-containing protein [Oceanicella actignis]TYO89476.1 putative hydroxymethylpyrimidine transport system ATP-binding protein [Oceanicella actignis]
MSAPPGLTLRGALRAGGRALTPPLEIAFPAGAWSCLLGPSGAGKSTLLRVIAGLDDQPGQARIAASDGAPAAPRAALMAQEAALLPWLDLRGNVELGPRLRGVPPPPGRADSLLAAVGMAGMARRRPRGLSGGQRQRVALARLLMEERPIALLDEPFSALDAGLRARMQELAARLLAGRTVIMVTHDAAEAARMADRIILLGAEGARTLAPPPGRPPRPLDDPGALRAQAALLRAMRAMAA